MTHWQISDRVAYVRSSPERVVVLHLDRPDEAPVALLGTGAAIWAELAGEDHTERPVVGETELISSLAEAFGVDPDVVASDVAEFLKGLANSGHIIAHATAE